MESLFPRQCGQEKAAAGQVALLFLKAGNLGAQEPPLLLRANASPLSWTLCLVPTLVSGVLVSTDAAAAAACPPLALFARQELGVGASSELLYPLPKGSGVGWGVCGCVRGAVLSGDLKG